MLTAYSLKLRFRVEQTRFRAELEPATSNVYERSEVDFATLESPNMSIGQPFNFGHEV